MGKPKRFKVLIAHRKNVTKFPKIFKHLEMEEKRLKALGHSNVALAVKWANPKDNLRKIGILLTALA